MRTRLTLLALSAALAGCPNRSQEPLPAPAPASITSFTASPSEVAGPGEEVTLEWGTAGATALTLEQVGVGPIETNGALSGRATVTVQGPATFILSAQGPGGGDLRTVTVSTTSKVRGVLLSAVPPELEAGEPARLFWNATGAKRVTIRELNGAELELGGQVESGSIEVRPSATTQYQITADSRVATATVTVVPGVTALTAEPSVAVFGSPVTLRWQAGAATRVTLTRVGTARPLVENGQAQGSFVDADFPQFPPDGVLTYVLEAADAQGRTNRRALDVPVGGAVEITTFTVPAYSLSGRSFDVAWTARGESLELSVDGQRRYLATSRAEISSGRYTLATPTENSVVTLVVRNSRGDEARETRTVQSVGPVALNSFTSDKSSIAAAGEPVTLTWSVANARNVRITSDSGAGFFRSFSGNVDTGTLTVYPNSRPPAFTRIVYTLSADNGTGAPPVRATVEVGLGAPVTFTFGRQLPTGARGAITGATLPSITTVRGFAAAVKNAPGDQFIDIRRSGTPVTFTGTNNAANFALPGSFDMTLFGARVGPARLNISKFGWFNVTGSSTVVPGPSENDLTLGSSLEPLAIAPYWRNLNTASGQVHWRLDNTPFARRLIVQWTGVRPVDGPLDARATFQAQLYSNGLVVMAYRELFKVSRGTVGVVNTSENNEISPSMPVATGDTWRFFDAQPFPAPFRVETNPYSASALIDGEPIELSATGLNLPAGQVVVNEIHPRPVSGVTNGEWVELRSASDAGFDLSGFELDFGGAPFTIPNGTVLAPGARLLLAQAMDLGDPNDPDGGILQRSGAIVPRPPVDIVYPATFSMGRNGGFARIGISGGEYFRLSYPAGGRVGAALGFEEERFPYVTYDSPTSRLGCAALRPNYGSNGQFGTPGLINQTCWAYDRFLPIGTPFQSIATTGTRIVFTGPDAANPLDEGLFVLNLAQPIPLFGEETTQITISTNGFVVPYAFSGCLGSACDFNPSTPGPPTASKPTFVIAPFWDDLDAKLNLGLGAGVYYQVGPTGDVLVSWERLHFFTFGTTSTGNVNFQVMLRANGDIEFRYGSMTGTSATRARGFEATTWIDMGRAANAVNVNSSTNPGISQNTQFFYRLLR